jgi:ATP-binding cassette, subfamily B, bacterial PglK
MFFLVDTYKKVNFVFKKTYSSYIPFLFLFVLLTIMEILSIGLIIPYMNLIFNPELLLKYEFINKFIKINEDLNTKSLIIPFSIIFGVIFLLKTFFIIFVRAQIQKFSLGNQKNLQIELMQTYQNMEYVEFSKKKQSEYIRNIREFSANSMTCLEMGLRVTSELIIIFAIITFLLFIEPLPLIAISLIISSSIIMYNFYLKPMAVKWGKEKTEATKLIYQSVDDSFKGFKSIQSLGKQKFFAQFLKRGTKQVFKNDLKSSIIISSPRYFLELVLVIFLVTYLSLSILSKGIDYNEFPTLVIFALAGLRILPSAAIISNGILMISYCNEALTIIYSDLKKYKLKMKDSFLNDENFKDNEDFNKSIELKEVSFSYNNAKKKILDKVNFVLNKNEFIGIIGNTGSGKTTFVDILLGFLKPTKGRILIDSKEQKVSSLNFHGKVGYLPQENFIINDTLEANIALNYNKDEVDRKKIREVLKFLELDNFVENLPKNIDTLIGENGVKLSGGQRQKVCLARLLYHNKEIIILDEATNALDKVAEKSVIESIKSLKNRTIIMISHDYENLKFCDKLYKLNNGKVELTNI